MDAFALIAAAGSINRLSVRLGVSRQTIHAWRVRGIPETRASWIREKAPDLAQAAQDRADSTNEEKQGVR